MGATTEPLTDGTAAYPWLIEDLADFYEFASNSAYWAARVHTKLMTDIDLAGRTYTTAVIAPYIDGSGDVGLGDLVYVAEDWMKRFNCKLYIVDFRLMVVTMNNRKSSIVIRQ